MKISVKILLPLYIVLHVASCNNAEKAKDYAQYVNPFVGTDYVGNTYPGATLPFGMVQLSPDNGLPGWDRISGYYYKDSTIAGFSHTHLSGTGAGELYDISFMPVTKPWREAEPPLGIHSRFSHENEEAAAGYYRVYLSDYDITVELTATERCGIQRYTFPEAEASVFLNLTKAMNWDATVDSKIEKVDSVTICGYRYSTGWVEDQRIYFVTKFSRPFESMTLDTVPVYKDEKRSGTGYTARFDFTTAEGDTIVVRTAISRTGIDGAYKNLAKEAPAGGFDHYRKAAYRTWNKELSKIEITTPDTTVKRTFYTALYHTMLAPTIESDVDGSYFGADKKIHRDSTMTTYGTFSLWDTYRAAHPLFTYLCPDRVNDMIKSFLNHYDQYGRLPVWSFYGNESDMMIGYHSVPVIADAYMKGIGDFDAEKALEACVATADNYDYRGIGLYKKYGYIPYNREKESLSKTIEYSYDDWCIAQLAKSLHKYDTASVFASRSCNYRNLYNPQTGFLQPRDDKGRFQPDFDPKEYTSHITESNAWQYLFAAQHDILWYLEKMGRDGVLAKLDTLFSSEAKPEDELPIFSTGMIGQYAHGNEPSHHVAYIYNYFGEEWKTQDYVTRIMYQMYNDTPSGLCGNEDCGQMSAWYVFSAMGIYPMNPAQLRYEMGAPVVQRAEFHLANGKTFVVNAPEASRENRYVQGLIYNGKPYKKNFITHEQIMSGGSIKFEMGSEPRK
ncbi:MAG: GH92 family glycosyl hydrolase [Bacteroidetes bacterium]|uniref:GH92 family glycosyl hydrolase n=1 Tax=Candidatus Caccoplasma merdipullorum TaxID=2840718 RepID=A0A9D9E1G8_9BACT|nr:GH92 family glycosyl hydrolase [Candidatus Caccoplasma merdipullorum]